MCHSIQSAIIRADSMMKANNGKTVWRRAACARAFMAEWNAINLNVQYWNVKRANNDHHAKANAAHLVIVSISSMSFLIKRLFALYVCAFPKNLMKLISSSFKQHQKIWNYHQMWLAAVAWVINSIRLAHRGIHISHQMVSIDAPLAHAIQSHWKWNAHVYNVRHSHAPKKSHIAQIKQLAVENARR